MTPRAVFDCMVFFQAASNRFGPAAACLDLVEARAADLFVSDDLLAEVENVLGRPKLRARFPHLTDAFVADFLARVRACAALVSTIPPVATLTRDPKDEKYLNLAVAANATQLVTRDNDLLDLMTGTDPDVVAFRTSHPGIAVLTPAAFLAVTRPTP